MAGSTFGTLFRVTTWGESHGDAVGAVIDGCPAGLPLSPSDIQIYLDRRKPGQGPYTTKRKESDTAQILSGVFDGQTTGTPISIQIANEDQHSGDYDAIKDVYRPGHADYTYDAKYGFRDYRGGGRSSGRETAARVAAGAVAAKLLSELGISLRACATAIGDVSVPASAYHYDEISENAFCMPNNEYAKKAAEFVDECKKKKDSCGGIIECVIKGMPAGIGEPVFQKLDAALGAAILSIGAVKGVEIGDGFDAARSTGSQNNDAFEADETGVHKKTNHAGGILGGISDGSPIVIRASMKPTPSIAQEQETINHQMENTTLCIPGRHDPVIVPRAVVVVESMAALTAVDLLMCNMSSRFEDLKDFYWKPVS